MFNIFFCVVLGGGKQFQIGVVCILSRGEGEKLGLLIEPKLTYSLCDRDTRCRPLFSLFSFFKVSEGAEIQSTGV